MLAYLVLANILWVKSSVNSGLEEFASMRRLALCAAISLAVKTVFPALSFPVAEARSSSMNAMCGFPWSGWNAWSWPARYNEYHIRLVMYLLKMELTCEWSIVLNSPLITMKIELSQVKGTLFIFFLQHVGGKVGDEKAVGGRKIVGRVYFRSHIFKWDISAISRKDTYVKPESCYDQIEHRMSEELRTMISHCV